MTTPPSKHINLRSLYTQCRRRCHRAGDPNLMTGQKICQDPRASTSKHSRLLNRQQSRLKSAPPLASNHPRESPCILLCSFQMTLLHASRRELRQFLRSSKVFNYQEQVWTQVIWLRRSWSSGKTLRLRKNTSRGASPFTSTRQSLI